MRKGLLLLALALIFGALSVLVGQTSPVAALGAPSDNTTVPNVPAGDQPQVEIKPPVEYVLLRPSSQPEATPPNFMAGFVSPSAQNEPIVAGNENWYLDLDVNTAGWIYIYEYFPPDQASPGQWITYKWQLPESGLWRFGPFAATDNEPEGQHAYGIWFYSDGQWATGNPETPQSAVIYWTYLKGQPAEPAAGEISPPPVSPPTETGFPAKVQEFLAQPVVLGICLLVIVAGLVFLVIYVWRRRSHYKAPLADEASPVDVSTTSSSEAAIAKLILPDGSDIRISGSSKVIGRCDLARTLNLDDLALISRRHFQIKSNDDQFYIEDLGSANGTLLNGKDIGSQGPVNLDNDDTVEPAGAISLKFRLL